MREAVFLSVHVLHLIATAPLPHLSRHLQAPAGTFNQPGVKHAEGQMRRTQRSSGAEITACVRPAYTRVTLMHGSLAAFLSEWQLAQFFFYLFIHLMLLQFAFFFIFFCLALRL